MGSDAKRYFRPAPEHLVDDALMRCAGVFADGVHAEHVSQAFDNRGFAGAAPANEYVQIWVEAKGRAIEKSALPRQRDELGMFFRGGVARQPDPRPRIEKGLPQTFNCDLGHLDPAGRRWVFYILGIDNILCVDRGHCPIVIRRRGAPILCVFIFDDLAYILGQILDRSRNLNREEVITLPGLDPRLSRKNLE